MILLRPVIFAINRPSGTVAACSPWADSAIAESTAESPRGSAQERCEGPYACRERGQQIRGGKSVYQPRTFIARDGRPSPCGDERPKRRLMVGLGLRPQRLATWARFECSPWIYRHLRDARLGPVAYARGKYGLQPALLIVAEQNARVIGIGKAQRLQLALEDVFRQRAARSLARRSLVRHGASGIGQRDRRVHLSLRGAVRGQTEVHRGGRLVFHDLHLERIGAGIAFDVRQPLIQGEERFQYQRRSRNEAAGRCPDHLVIVTAVVAIEAVPLSPCPPVRMDVTGDGVVSAQIDDRYPGPLPAVAHEAAAVVGMQDGRVRRHAVRTPDQVRVITADTFVQLYEFFR